MNHMKRTIFCLYKVGTASEFKQVLVDCILNNFAYHFTVTATVKLEVSSRDIPRGA